jgi:uncharacterized protein
MIHPDTELRFVSPVIGYGVFATRDIPKGTITWVRDEFDQTFAPERVRSLDGPLRDVVSRYCYVDGRGDHVLCWDLARYLNHACEATCLSPGYGFEIAVRDIAAGEELTDDYGTLNLDAPFECHCGSPRCRGLIRPDDILTHADRWDGLIAEAFERLPLVDQRLWPLLRDERELRRVLAREAAIASCRDHYLGARAP